MKILMRAIDYNGQEILGNNESTIITCAGLHSITRTNAFKETIKQFLNSRLYEKVECFKLYQISSSQHSSDIYLGTTIRR